MKNDNSPRLLDLHLADFLTSRCALPVEEKPRFRALVEKLSLAMDNGHSCLELDAEEKRVVQGSPLVSGDGQTPLIIRDDLLYLHRYYRYESRLANQLKNLSKKSLELEVDESVFESVFGPGVEEPDYQRKAAELALKKSLCIISGGPGTGKTTTVVKILALLLMADDRELHIALAAPTGKAAMRLQESIGGSVKKLSVAEDIQAKIPDTASTLHRLLGVRRHSPQFRHTADNPMGWDVVVVDEASMVDLAMMSKVVDALKPGARLLLLGDKDQLASVESGAVLLDCIRSLPENTVELKKSYRFDSGIKQFAEAINRGDGERAWQLLSGERPANVTVLRNSYFNEIGDRYETYMRVVRKVGCATPEGLEEVFRCFNSFQVLCGTRHGGRGVRRINDLVEKHLKIKGFDVSFADWYVGRPIMITANDYTLELFNGDIGICLPDPESGTLKVWFEKGSSGFRSCLPYRIPQYETVYAMTIHKSQGSEFSDVMVILPEEESRILNRQLIYTAVTRAKEFVQVVASKTILVYALQSDYPRSSGLSQMLQK